MDRKLYQASLTGDAPALLELAREDKRVLEQRIIPSLNTPLHLASRLGHIGLVSELIRLRPELVMSENAKLETPLHDASREGHLEVCNALVDADTTVAYRLDCDHRSALFVACSRGHLPVAKFLLDVPWLLASEEDGSSTSLHVAATDGHIEIVREILRVRPDFVSKIDGRGCYPIHLASSKGHVEIIREFLRVDPNLCRATDEHGTTPLHIASSKGYLEVTREFLRIDSDLCNAVDEDGKTPLHLATIRGFVAILHEILSTCRESARLLTKQGESVLHLVVKNNRYDALRCLMENFDIAELINLTDRNGNTVFHLATLAKLTTMVKYLAARCEVNVNAVNHSGLTALDIITTNSTNSSGALQLVAILQSVGAKRAVDVRPGSPLGVQNTAVSSHPARSSWNLPWKKKQPESPSRRRRRRKERRLELHNEGLRNARNTINIVAVLIATVAFSAGIAPPGGVFQDGPLVGKATAVRSTAFKVFKVSNDIALFVSLGIVTVLVSIIPFRRRSMMRLLVVTHKAMWVAVTFMAAAYVAATWVVMPRGRGMTWLLVTVVTVGGGGVGSMLVGLGVMLVMHWLRKWEWKRTSKERGRSNRVTPESSISRVEELRGINTKGSSGSSNNSDLESSERSGYHTY
ncbi:ankyrin repeat-containing protein [Cocos nucifera]|uniref:Ankyrin repeat-containing protein n=1 Tax=Cocos nucifera TaxID=13894 RepID=A0A8K0MYP6_COCNU|nr:ankyrin repeat-containing protein [Cocos nucifera]